MLQPIQRFTQDEQGHWVALLECGHRQHVRHDPPWMNREWVMSKEGRDSRLGAQLDCKICEGAGRETEHVN